MSTCSRRTVLRGLGFGAALAASPRLFAAGDNAVLKAGKYTFEWLHGWGEMPVGMTYGNTHGCVATDSQNRAYVNTDSHGVVIFDPDGKFVKSWGNPFGGGTHGMAIVKEGSEEVMYQTHLGKHQVFKTTLDGKVLQTWDYPDKSGVYKNKGQYNPTSVAVAPNGDFYVGDGYGQHWVHHYGAKGEYVRSFGGIGKEAGKINTPHGVWVDTRKDTPVLMVADRGNSRLQIFDLEGKHLGFVHEELRSPCHLAINAEGDVVVPDLAGRVTLLDENNKLIGHLGESKNRLKGQNGFPPQQWKDGEFTAPHCACWDREGNILVQDWNFAGRWCKLKRIK